ncbi:MAG: glycosyltransferase family 4 protein, partial [Nitrospira sp.]|nr:glycosyltransferase family 4 protein [Nitrospira sp.]
MKAPAGRQVSNPRVSMPESDASRCVPADEFRVSIPLGSFHLSGGVKVLVLLANGMADQGWGTTFLVPDYASASPFALDRRIKVRVISTGPRWLPRRLRQVTYYGKLLGLASGGAHLCLANYYLTAYCAVVSSLLAGRKTSVLWYVQGYEAGSHGLMAEDGIIGRLLRYVLASMSYRLPVPILCVSQWVRERI